MESGKTQQVAIFRSMQVLLLVFSLIFFFIIAYGYYNLLLGSGVFLAFVGGTVMAVLAWYLARVIGTSPGGLKVNWVLFIPLLIISAAGVYNSMMVYLEGGRILSETATSAQERFANIERLAETGLSDSGATTKLARVNSLSEALFSEIRNPLDCGQGPEARRLIAELQRELPGFHPLSARRRDCAQNEAVIEDYRSRIAALVSRASWNNSDLRAVISASQSARNTLDEIRSNVTTNYSPVILKPSLNELEAQDVLYRDLRFRLAKQVDVKVLPSGLHLSEAQSLGNAFKLPALFIERLDEAATYVYLAIAVGFDYLMVYLFELVAANRRRRKATPVAVGGAW